MNCKWYIVCPMNRYNKLGLVKDEVINKYCKGNWKTCIRYQKEEAGIYHEDYMMPDGTLNYTLKDK